jgi:hypothetical protein
MKNLIIEVLFSSSLFPYLQVALSLCAAGRYAVERDWWRVVYWGAASLIIVAVIKVK